MVDKKKKVLGAGGVAMTPNEATEAARKNAFASVPKVQNPSGGSNVGIKKSTFNREDVLSRAMSGQNVPSTREIELANLSPEERAGIEQARTQKAALFIAKRNLEQGQIKAEAERTAIDEQLAIQEAAAPKEETLTEESGIEIEKAPYEESGLLVNPLIAKGMDVGAQALGIEGLPEARAQFEQVVMKTGAQIYDFVYSLTQGGKGIEQKEAEATWADVKASMSSNLAGVRSGTIDPDTVESEILLAERTNNRLEQSTKSWSSKNLRYFITDGIDVETQVILNRQAIERWKLELEEARYQSKVNQLRQTLPMETIQ